MKFKEVLKDRTDSVGPAKCSPFGLGRVIAILAASLLSLVLEAGTTNTVRNVTELVDALRAYQSPTDVIQVEAGDYDLTGINMLADPGIGKSHLTVNNAKLIGMGTSPDDVRLISDGSMRVFIAYSPAQICNLTISGGYARKEAEVAWSGSGGGIIGDPAVFDCVIENCKADNNGGGVQGGMLVGCRVLNCTCPGSGGGAYEPGTVIRCEFRGNSANGAGGGVCGGGATAIFDSMIAQNVAGSIGGGIAAVSIASNTTFVLNESKILGGGVAGWTAYDESKVCYDCVICSNKSIVTESGGGGAARVSLVGGKVFANGANFGGGVFRCNLSGVDIHDNCAMVQGGGIYISFARGCKVGNNYAPEGMNGFGVDYDGCTIYGSTDTAGSYMNCKICDFSDSMTLTGNPYNAGTYDLFSALNARPACTNCLFTNIVFSRYSGSLIAGDGFATKPLRFVNCTVASNQYCRTFTGFYAAGPVIVQNCVFFGNKFYDGLTAADFAGWDDFEAAGVRVSNTAYGTSIGLYAQSADWQIDAVYRFGFDDFPENPRFMGHDDQENPFALKRKSPLIGKGSYEDWMLNATDIRGPGFPRSTDGNVDLGCYQCNIAAPGFALTIR